MSETPSNAVFVIAALSVIVFSLVGVGVMTGVIPSSISKSADPKTAHKDVRGTAASRAAPAQYGCADCGRVEMVSLVEPREAPSDLVAGSEIAYHPKAIPLQRYEVLVRLADGTARAFSYETQPMFRPGDTVRISGGTLLAH